MHGSKKNRLFDQTMMYVNAPFKGVIGSTIVNKIFLSADKEITNVAL